MFTCCWTVAPSAALWSCLSTFYRWGSLDRQRAESVVGGGGSLVGGMQAPALFHIAARQIGLVILELQGKSA